MLSNHMSYTKIALTITIFLTMLLLAISCKECPTEPDYDIYLAVEDVACIWVTLKVTLPDSGKINRFELDRNDSTVAAYTCYDNDTLITDEGLIPDKDYSYTIRFLKDGKTKAESEPVTVHTMPTTSHNFVWEIDTLGNYGSYLNDVWIIDENDIWVVGYLRVDDPDSSFDGTGQETFNAARWDGEKWNLMLIVNPDPLYSIFYFNENDMWMSNGLPIHWDGNNWTLYHIQQMGISANVEYGIWGTSSLDIYFVGRFGSIVHYNGSTFRKIESGTGVKLRNISGSSDGEHVFVTGYDNAGELSGQSVALELVGESCRILYQGNSYSGDLMNGDYGRFQAVEVFNETAYFSTGGTWLVKYNFSNKITQIEGKYSHFNEGYCMATSAGNSAIDMFLVCCWGPIFHYNGASWNIDMQITDQFPLGILVPHSIRISGDVVAIAYELGSWEYALVARGYRN